MNSGTLRFAKNAVANIVNGASSAIFAIVLPYFFVRLFSRAEFGLWVLVLQLAAYVNYLNFGLQVAVGRYVSHALERGDREHAEKIVAAGLKLLSVLAIIGIVIIAALAWLFPLIFRQVDTSLVPTAQSALMWVGSALAVSLPFSAFSGVFIGLQRNEVPAIVAAGGKGVLAVALIVAATLTRSLSAVAFVYFWVSLIANLPQYFWFLTTCRGWKLRLTQSTRPEMRELVSYCTSLTIWSFAMLLISGMGAAIVAFFDFSEVAAYGAAMSAVAFLVGIIQAISAPLVQVFAKMQARSEAREMIRLLHISSFACTLVLLLGAAWLIGSAKPVFTVWVGPAIAEHAVPLFCLIVLATAVRSTAIPYANYLIATGQQRRVLLSPFAEGVSNFLTSVLCARYFGAYGVAVGALVGGVVGVTANYAYNFARTTPPGTSIWEMATANLSKPLIAATPAFAALALARSVSAAFPLQTGLLTIGTLRGLFILWHIYQRERLGGRRVAPSLTVLDDAHTGGKA